MKSPLPKRLKKEPLIDAVFELRFSSLAPASSILPGILFSKLEGKKNIVKLPASQLPEQVRANDPNLQFAPIIRLEWERFVILISDRGMAIACNIPYPGWTAFKAAILETLKYLSDSGIVTTVQRTSLKYVDIIPAKTIREQVSVVNLDLRIGSHQLTQEIFQVRVEVKKDSLINVIQIASSAEVILFNGNKKNGLIVDIDTISTISDNTMTCLLEVLPEQLETMHTVNNELFFECLRPETINDLEPIYG